MSLSSHDVLRIDNLSSTGDSEVYIKETMKAKWYDGYTEERSEDHGLTWSLTLGGDVWTASGIHGVK